MGEYFRGWKRKLGAVTLLLACAFIVVWISLLDGSIRHQYLWQTSETSACRILVGKTQIMFDSASASLPLFVFAGFNSNQLYAVRLDQHGQALNYPAQTDSEMNWSLRLAGFATGECSQDKRFEFHYKTWRVPYWSIILPLTALSAWLLLSKRRQPKVIDQPREGEARS